jgi:hypothetical protein
MFANFHEEKKYFVSLTKNEKVALQKKHRFYFSQVKIFLKIVCVSMGHGYPHVLTFFVISHVAFKHDESM